MNLNLEDILLLDCVKPNLSQIKLHDIECQTKTIKDWDYFVKGTTQNGLAPLVYNTIARLNDKSNIPESVIAVLQKYYYKTLSKNTVLYDSFKTITTLWSNADIKPIALKGIYLAECVYTDIGLRQLSDIDLLVPYDKDEHCAQLLIEIGYSYESLYKSEFIKNTKQDKHMAMLIKNGVGIEIHRFLNYADTKFNIPILDYWKNTQIETIANTSVLKFNPNYLLLSICIHLDEHIIDGKMHFIAYIDILWIIEKFKNEIDWISFTEMCKKYNCISNVYRHFYLCNKYFKAPFPEYIIEESKVYITEYTESFFVNNLQCNTNFDKKIRNRNIADLELTKGFKNKIHFLLGDMFPSKSFMYFRYNIKNPKAIYWFYLVRQFDGIKGLLKYILKIKHI
jgi:hypothetical protein